MPENTRVEISGMSCAHSARHLGRALRRVPRVSRARVSYSRVIADAEPDGVGREDRGTAGEQADCTATARDSRSSPEGAAEAARPAPTGHRGGNAADLLIIGGGSAGFAAAIAAAELGASVTLVEGGTLGGTCVNVGCVPSKTLIRAAEAVHRAGRSAFAGVRTQVAPVALDALVAQKDDLVASLRQAKYRDVLAAYPSVKLVEGTVRLAPDGAVTIAGKPVQAGKVIVAAGAHPWAPPIPGLADVPYLTSTEALALKALPRRLLVLGGGAAGVELAQMFARLGSEVTVLEAMPGLVPGEDAEIGDALAGYLREEGMIVRTGVTVTGVAGRAGSYRVRIRENGGEIVLEADQLLVATGRRANTAEMGIEAAGIRLGGKGEVIVNDYLETSRAGVYAAGDVTGDPMFVYVAAYAGNLAASNALRGNKRRYDLSALPRVTFTDPGVASVGLTEAAAQERGGFVAVAKLPMSCVPRALAARDTRGFIKLIADSQSGQLLGAHVLAPEAGEMIETAAMAMHFGIRVQDIAQMFHPYLTNAEGIKLTAQAFHRDPKKLSCCAS